MILNFEKNSKSISSTEFDVIEKFDTLHHVKNTDSRVSSFLTIQEGCDKFCKFCVVPYTRGAEFSRSIEEIIKEAKQLVKNGSREITLLGQNVNAYNSEGYRLSDLILEIEKISELKRIRYTTSHPIDFTDDLIQAHKISNKLMPLIHLPIQSGSNKILKKMNRKHTTEEYIEIIRKLKKVNSNIKFSSDFIIGYPGETKKDFEKTLELMEIVKFINSFSFIFSARPGTPSFKLKKVDYDIAKKRLNIFQEKSKKVKTEYRKTLLDKSLPVLFENETKEKNIYFGRDEFFNSVIVKSNENLTGKIKNIKITKVSHNTLFGKIVSKLAHKDFAA